MQSELDSLDCLAKDCSNNYSSFIECKLQLTCIDPILGTEKPVAKSKIRRLNLGGNLGSRNMSNSEILKKTTEEMAGISK